MHTASEFVLSFSPEVSVAFLQHPYKKEIDKKVVSTASSDSSVQPVSAVSMLNFHNIFIPFLPLSHTPE